MTRQLTLPLNSYDELRRAPSGGSCFLEDNSRAVLSVSDQQIGRPLGHRVNELTPAFDRLRVVYYEDTVGPADWNGGKPAPIVGFIARKEQK